MEGIWPGHRVYTPTLYEKCHGIFNDHRESGIGLTSHPKDVCLLFFGYCSLSNYNLQNRAVVLESGLETFFNRLGLVLDSLVLGLGLVSDLVIGLAKCSSWSLPSPAIYAFFLFQNKTINLARLFRKRVT